jgi:hypothetical protein
LVLDPYYHLFIAQQVVDAGGPIAYEWWQVAPGGRPHLYPPLLHLILAALLKMGWSPIFVLRFVSGALLPGLLLSILLVMRRLFPPSVALACLWMGMVPFSFHLHTAITMAATLSLIELVWLIDALEHDRWIAAGLLVALLCYTHLGLPGISLVIICGYGILQPTGWRKLKNASWGLVLALPWYAHLLGHWTSLHVFPRYENTMVEVVPLLYAIALAGMWRCWRLKGRYSWPLACWLGFGLLAPHYPFRWLSGEGLLPIILLAGVGLDWCSRWLTNAWATAPRSVRARWRDRHQLLVGLSLFLVLVSSPTLARTPTGWRWLWPDSAPWHLLNADVVTRKALDASLHSSHIDSLVQRVIAHSQPHEILWSNASYAGGLIASLSHRATSSSMFDEVPPARPFDPVAAAHLLVWFKVEPLPGTPQLASLIRRYGLELVAEDDLALLFRNPRASQFAHPPQAIVRWPFAFMLLCALTGLTIWDSWRMPGERSRGSWQD